MTTQPHQRAKMKGQMTTSKRVCPSLVNRSNKTIFVELTPICLKLTGRLSTRFFLGSKRY